VPRAKSPRKRAEKQKDCNADSILLPVPSCKVADALEWLALLQIQSRYRDNLSDANAHLMPPEERQRCTILRINFCLSNSKITKYFCKVCRFVINPSLDSSAIEKRILNSECRRLLNGCPSTYLSALHSVRGEYCDDTGRKLMPVRFEGRTTCHDLPPRPIDA
jgi:hypothetical protein